MADKSNEVKDVLNLRELKNGFRMERMGLALSCISDPKSFLPEFNCVATLKREPYNRDLRKEVGIIPMEPLVITEEESKKMSEHIQEMLNKSKQIEKE